MRKGAASSKFRPNSRCVSSLIIFDLSGPALDSTARVECHEIAVQGGHKYFVVEDRRPAIDVAEADRVVVLRDRPLPRPQFTPGAQVERGGGVWPGDVHNTVDH